MDSASESLQEPICATKPLLSVKYLFFPYRVLYVIFNIFLIEFTLSRSVRTVAHFHFTGQFDGPGLCLLRIGHSFKIDGKIKVQTGF